MTTYHAHVTFREAEGASAEMVSRLFKDRGWRVADVVAGEVYVELEASEAAARERLADVRALLGEAGYEKVSVAGPVAEEELLR